MMSIVYKSAAYCNSPTAYSRLLTREVKIGDVPLGAHHPIRVQSMTTTDTMDTAATVAQSIRMIEAGCEYVRITAPSINEAKNLEAIKHELRKRGYNTPLIADIHFTPNAAELAARIVEKVRVNPGNYADKKKFEVIDYTDATYDAELDRIRKRFTPLVKICKEYGTAMRIGTNHGSLSDRILSRYGDTPEGMVASAFEFLNICEDEGYYNIVLSMKASNAQVMVQAYRLLVQQMHTAGMNYPLHLGVTEAGEGEDGRIKSAAGIGTLLEDGIGDTIRVSLTEDPEFEIPVAKALVDRYRDRVNHAPVPELNTDSIAWDPFTYTRRSTAPVQIVGGHQVPVVVADFSHKQNISAASLFASGYNYSAQLDKWNVADQACDFIYAGNQKVNFEIPGTLHIIYDAETWKQNADQPRCYPLLTVTQLLQNTPRSSSMNFVEVVADEFYENGLDSEFSSQLFDAFRNDGALIAVLSSTNIHNMAAVRRFLLHMNSIQLTNPVILNFSNNTTDSELFRLYNSTDAGALLLDGFGDGVWLSHGGRVSENTANSTAFGILQASRTRISKTEYISCPSCGRTLFDLQETTAKIRSRTDHLKGVKIGIMGCIVNGPGEMADADYGYVGVGPGKITLYKGKEVVQRNIDSEFAVDALIDLIKQHGDWKEING